MYFEHDGTWHVVTGQERSARYLANMHVTACGVRYAPIPLKERPDEGARFCTECGKKHAELEAKKAPQVPEDRPTLDHDIAHAEIGHGEHALTPEHEHDKP